LAEALPAAAQRRAKLLRRTRVGGGLALGLGLLLWGVAAAGSGKLVFAIAAGLGLLAASEAGGLLSKHPRSGRALGALAGLAAAGPWWLALGRGPGLPSAAPIVAYGLAFALAALCALPLRPREPAERSWALPAWFWLAWVSAPLAGLSAVYARLGESGAGARELIALIVLSKVGDIVGYYGGSAFGRHHPFPRLSPGKTSEGCFASLLGALLAAAILAQTGVLRLPLGSALLIGAAINLASQAGDLLESRLKRSLAVKDSGSLFGPSGGFLDLVDSLLLSIPVALALWPALTT
jgi:CDP-diglyceride synthetase